MIRGETKEIMWGIGLDVETAEAVRRAAGDGFQLQTISPAKLNTVGETTETSPMLIWIPFSVWESMTDGQRSMLENMEQSQRALILDNDNDDVEFERIISNGFLTGLKKPLTHARLQEAVFRAAEINSLYADIFRMTREIFLERELLARKTDQLLFLNRVLSRATETLDIGVILSRAKEDMSMLFPVTAVQAVFWKPTDNNFVECELMLAKTEDERLQSAWVDYLLESAEKLSSGTVKGYHVDSINPDAEGQPQNENRTPALPKPSNGNTVLMPLRTGYEYFGCLALTAAEKPNMAKDQVQTVRAAVNHLALALNNALLYNQVKVRAEYDGLTHVRNRHSFDERLVEELKRHQRYGHEVSLLLLDLDHFKNVNDVYGHQAGDMVLREVGRILSGCVRSTDFTARYGGEEFVTILPQTGEEEAWLLAERIRRRIESFTFHFDGQSFKVTASIGIASLHPGPLSNVSGLVREADEALYLAKSSGRNMVCVSAKTQAPTAVRQ